MLLHRLRTTATFLAAAGLGLSAWAQSTPPVIAPPSSAVSSPGTSSGEDSAPNATGGSATSSGKRGANGATGTTGTPPAPASAQRAPTPTDSKPAHADASFMNDAAHAGHFEVEGAKLALQKAHSDAVKSFAQRMIDDHTAAAQQLETLSAAKNHKLPDGPSLLQKGKLKLLSTHDGAKFDQSYIDSLGPKAHRETIELFEKGATKAHDPDVKAWAERTLPTLREHLTLAEQLDRSANGADPKHATRDAPLHDNNARNK